MQAQSTEDRLYRDRAMIAETPGLANGGIVLIVLEPETVGWERIAAHLDDYGFIAFTSADKRTVFDQISANLGATGEMPYWDAFTGSTSDAVPLCDTIVRSAPAALTLCCERVPDSDTIAEVIALNREVGVSPLPAWYMRSEGPPSFTGWIRAADGRMIACANASLRYHPHSRLAGTCYVGSVSVAPSERGKGLGTLVTALLIRDAAQAFDATAVTGVAQPGNAPSRAMLVACGLVHDPSRATVIYNRSGAFHTR